MLFPGHHTSGRLPILVHATKVIEQGGELTLPGYSLVTPASFTTFS